MAKGFASDYPLDSIQAEFLLLHNVSLAPLWHLGQLAGVHLLDQDGEVAPHLSQVVAVLSRSGGGGVLRTRIT